MLWERAKNLILIFLLLLNGFLAVLLYREQNRYTLTTERENAIINVLGQNQMTMYSEIIRKFPPMSTLRLSGYVYDTNALLELFFTAPESAVPTGEPDMEAYESGEGRLSISNGYISFTRYTGRESGNAITPETAKELCGEFIKQNYPDYVLDDKANDGRLETTDEGYLRLTYRQEFRDIIVYRNFIEFLVTGDGIEQIEMQYGAGVRYDDDQTALEICAPDEALLTFIQYHRGIYGSAPVIIDNMDLVYNQEEFSTLEDELHAIPFYRVFVKDNYVPFLINAYTNVCAS